MPRLLITSLLLVIGTAIFAQTTTLSTPQLIQLYRSRNTDTTKVRLLLELDSVYLYRMPDTDAILDSALLMAQQARDMSASLHFKPGYEDATFLIANSFAEQKNLPSAMAVAQLVSGALRVHIYIMIGERYLFRPGELKKNLDSAYPFIMHAKAISDTIHSSYWLYQSLCLLGKYFFALGDIESGRKCFQPMIQDYHRAGNIKSEAHWWTELGRYMPHTDSTYNEVTNNLAHALFLYKQVDSKVDEAEVLEALAYLHKLHPDMVRLAETELQEAIKLRQSSGRNLYFDYSNLAGINALQGNYNISLYYALAAVKNMDSLHAEYFSGGVNYSQLAGAYKAVGDIDNSLKYYKKALHHLVDYRIEYLFPICGEIVQALLLKDSAKEALTFLQNFVRNNSPARFIDKEIVAAAMGDCFTALQKYDKAENSYRQMIGLDSLAQTHMKQQSVGERSNTITGSEAYYTIGRFYVLAGQYALAKTYLTEAISFVRFAPSLARQRDIHLLLFRIDSAQGNYRSAIRHLQQQEQLNDSLFNDRKSHQIAELQIQYKTEKREKDLQVLQSNELVKDKELQKSLQSRNYTYILLVILLILIVVVFNRYLLKQKNNRQLQAKQEVINGKNTELQHLLTDKDKLINEKDTLLEEKEWLLKEVHHRVKNNLQIMTSLLNTQSKYLNNAEAIDAITESRHRMQAMSLVHQKLYDSADTGSVNMQTYIKELIAYLEACFHTAQTIFYQLCIHAIDLPVAQAIPVGLLLNEAITNAIKYAFTGRENGVISISMKHHDNKIQLEIHDNGNGLPGNFNTDGNHSMGMRLMKGLVKQIDGDLVIKNERGVCIEVEFETDNQP